MAIKYFTIFAIVCVVVAAVLIVPSESSPLTNQLGDQVNLMNAAPVDNNREGRQYYGGYGYPGGFGGLGGSAASASASASASSGGFGGIGGYPMYGKK